MPQAAGFRQLTVNGLPEMFLVEGLPAGLPVLDVEARPDLAGITGLDNGNGAPLGDDVGNRLSLC